MSSLLRWLGRFGWNVLPLFVVAVFFGWLVVAQSVDLTLMELLTE